MKEQQFQITLRRDIRPGSKREILERLVSLTGIHSFNRKRYERYGILCGTMNPASLESVKNDPDIQSVRQVQPVNAGRDRSFQAAGAGTAKSMYYL